MPYENILLKMTNLQMVSNVDQGSFPRINVGQVK
jgi:hypothetical protein